MPKRLLFLLIFIILTSGIIYAADPQVPTTPLITDQAYTTGRNNWLLAVNNGYSTTGHAGSSEYLFYPTLYYGAIDQIDIILGFMDTDLFRTKSFDSIGMNIGLKALIHKDNVFALSVKSVLNIPSLSSTFSNTKGAHDNDISLIGSMNMGSFIINENIGYDSIKKQFFLSSSGEYIASDKLALTLDIGTHQFAHGELFAMGGAIFAITNAIYLDLGVNVELKGSKDVDGLLGLTFKF